MEYEQKWGTALPHLVPKPSSFSILLILGASCRGFSGLGSNRATKYEGSGLFHGHMEISYPKISSEMFDEDMERGGGGRGTWHMTVESENRREPLFQWQSFTKECVVTYGPRAPHSRMIPVPISTVQTTAWRTTGHEGDALRDGEGSFLRDDFMDWCRWS